MANTPEDFYRDERFWDSTASALASALGLERAAVDHLTWQKDMLQRETYRLEHNPNHLDKGNLRVHDPEDVGSLGGATHPYLSHRASHPETLEHTSPAGSIPALSNPFFKHGAAQ